MNKKEQAEMERLKTLLALRHYPEVNPDVMPPDYGSEIKNGYVYNTFSGTVCKACTSFTSHCIGEWDKTTSQKPIKLYSTEKLAYEAMLHDMAMMFARKLRLVEIAMENLKENNEE